MKIVIVGAGQAGAWVARSLRQEGCGAPVVLLGDERHPPYERPPLSKEVMAGKDAHPPCLMSKEQARELDIDLRLNTAAVSIDRLRQAVTLQDGGEVGYDYLVLATGGRARRADFPGAGLAGVYTLRSLDDAAAIRQKLVPGRRLLILGGGWIGLEVAATARRLGVEVMLIESGPRLCARSVPPVISDFLLHLHRREGVDVHLMGSVSKVELAPGSGLAVHTHQGVRHFDAMVLGIGLDPNIDLAVSCGLAVDNGVFVDERGQTSDPRIFAVGDVANQPCAWIGAPGGARIRLESWANAQGQGIALGRILAGRQDAQQDQPWFWSDQYDVNLQVLGMPSGAGTHVLRGSVEDARFCMFQLVDQRVQSVIAVNMPKELKLAKRWNKQGRCPSPAELQDLTLRLERL